MNAVLDLLDFIPALSPRFAAPRHLSPVADLFERIARGEQVKAVTNVPPRFGKTELILHGGAWPLLQNPALQLGYASHGQRIAEKKSRRMRELSRRAGVPLSADSQSRSDWRTGQEEGGCWATSPSGAVTGEGFDVLILDDLTPGRAAAESGASRDRINEWLIADALTRLEPGGSVILNQTRWHPDDPAGRALALGWEHVNLQALDAEERSLWPERWSVPALQAIRETMGGPDGYEWQSLYMGNPRGRGSRVFGDVHFYDELPDLTTAEISIGFDFAYSSKKTADWSVAVVMARMGSAYYVLDVVRVHEEPRAFRDSHSAHSRAAPASRGVRVRGCHRARQHRVHSRGWRAGRWQDRNGRQVQPRHQDRGGLEHGQDPASALGTLARCVRLRVLRLHGREGQARRSSRRASCRV
jgi:hypothetical protein